MKLPRQANDACRDTYFLEITLSFLLIANSDSLQTAAKQLVCVYALAYCC